MPNIFTSPPSDSEYLGQLGGGDGLAAILIEANRRLNRQDPWIEEQNTWTRIDDHSFSIASDITTYMLPGTLIRFQDVEGTNKYGVVGTSEYNGSISTITLIDNDDYLMTSSSPINTYYTNDNQAKDFPAIFRYTPTYSGFSSPPVDYAFWHTSARRIFLDVSNFSPGTSNSTTFYVGLPIRAYNISFLTNYPVWRGFGIGVDNGTSLSTPIYMWINENATSAQLFTSISAGGWTNSGNKSATFSVSYPF